MKTLLDPIQQDIDELHFTQALQLLNQIPEEKRTAQRLYQAGVCYSAIYASKLAEKEYQKALEKCESKTLSIKIYLRLLALYLQTGQTEKADKVYLSLQKDFKGISLPESLFYEALYHYEKGELNEGLELALELAQLENSSLNKIRCEAWSLCGDLYSAQGSLKEATKAYGQALRLLKIWPKNWRPLRKALILNNLADVYEQFEQWSLAKAVYKQAWKAILEVDDEQIYDLKGYKLEILFSIANFYALIDELDLAQNWLRKAEIIAKQMPKPCYYYWMSRVNYIDGLCELYAQNPSIDPFEKLFKAWQLQNTFLSLSPAASKEYLGRTAYYAAYTYNEEIGKIQGISQKKLYEQALMLFEQCAFKDPKFFLFSIASIYNELATLEIENDPSKATSLYFKAINSYCNYLQSWPEDLLAQSSLLVALLNLFSVINVEKLEEHQQYLLDLFEKTLVQVWNDPETHEQALEALERLLENDALYQLNARRLEEIHDAFLSQTIL